MQTTTVLFERLIPLLERASIPYMVAGSVASSVHGSPRSTQDVDLGGAVEFDVASLELSVVANRDLDQVIMSRWVHWLPS